MIPSDAGAAGPRIGSGPAGRWLRRLVAWGAHSGLAGLLVGAGLAAETASTEGDHMIEAIGRGHGPDGAAPPGRSAEPRIDGAG